MSEELTVEQIVATYIKLRRRKEAVENEVKEKLIDIKTKMLKLEAWIRVKSDETGVKSFKTDAGTAFLTTNDFASVADWDQVLDFVKQNDAWDMLTKGVSKVAVRSYIDANKTVPSGVTFGTKVGVSVRSPSRKV